MNIDQQYLLNELTKSLAYINQKRTKQVKLILHVGTPKTGTTSLQNYLAKRQSKLRKKGILYPHNLENIKNSAAPQHHWVEKNLLSGHLTHFLENVQNVISQIKDDTHTIILSSEGIYNYWWDIPDESKALLSQFCALFDTNVWVWFREPVAFIESYYKQCIRNPEVKANPCYGKDLSFDQMLEIKWFHQHLDYQGFVFQCQTLFGKNNVLAFEYQGDVVQQVIQHLGLATAHDNPTPRQNQSLNSVTIALLRGLNQHNISAKDKDRLILHLKNINDLAVKYDQPLINNKSRDRVLALANPIEF